MSNLFWLIQRPYRLCFFITFCCAFIGIAMKLHTMDALDYDSSTGYVSNVEDVSYDTARSHVERYNFDLLYYYDEEPYTCRIEQHTEYVREGEIAIWVHPDNEEVILKDPHATNTRGNQLLIGAAVAAVIGIIVRFVYRK